MTEEMKIGEYSIGHLLSVAKNTVLKKTKDSVVLDIEAEKRIPKFKKSELDVGRVLGRGGFCVVHEITNISLQNDDSEQQFESEKFEDEYHIHNIVQDRDFMQAHCVRQGKDCRYAIKKVQESSFKDEHTFINAVVDLAIEARFLSVVRNPNIIKMRAMEINSPYRTDFFVVLDKLYDIMPVRLMKWKKRQPKGLGKMMDRGGKKEQAFWVERCTVAYDLSCALKYLHGLRIVYRDLKPDNIGFDVRGDVKIFDFGLAKEFNPDKKNSDGFYKMTGDTGSPRYMAAEVAKGEGYNETVDVYSFSVLLWQILKLETPFEGFTLNMFHKKVVQGGARPKCDPKWPKAITTMLQKGWGEACGRPSMEDVSLVLREEINRLSDEGIDEIMDASAKSALSFHVGN